MEAVFIKLLNMSITAGYLVLAVVLLRLLLKKAPKAIFVAMWALVGLRLMVPFSLESIFSLIPSAFSRLTVSTSGVPPMRPSVPL